MPVTYRSPGVYREELFLQPQVSLLTGVPGFVGWFTAKQSEGEVPVHEPILLHRKEEFTNRFVGLSNGYLADAIYGFFENGGARCYVLPVQQEMAQETALIAAIAALEKLTDIDLVAIPDLMLLPRQEAIYRVQQAMIDHCDEQGDRLAILDTVEGGTVAAAIAQRQQLTRNRSEPGINAALYYPWIRTARGRWVPPCGHVAGVFARSDRTLGIAKAPANEILRDVIDLSETIDNTVQDVLNPEGINALRAFPGRGIRIWGARTLSQDRSWRYVNVRRLFLLINRWIEHNMQWAVFEPNSFQLWVRVQRELSSYLQQLFQAGSLQGQTTEQAFFVKCDAETNPPESRKQGQVMAEVGLAVHTPAEFIVMRIIQTAGTTEVSVDLN